MRLLCFGEIVWDEIQGERHIGGAPFNVAAHAQILGIDEVLLLSTVGNDPLGKTTLDAVRASGVNDTFVRAADTDTCVVKATLDERGNATFHIPDPTSFDRIEATDDDVERIRALNFDCLYFGTIAQRYCPAAPVEVADTIGAGDAFAAAMICKLYLGAPPSDACAFACRVGGLVASRRGAVPSYSLADVLLDRNLP
jgi:fructokinase